MDAIVEPIRRMAARSSGYGARFGVLCFPFLQRERFDPATDRCPFRHLLSLAASEPVPLLDPIPAYAHYPNREIGLDDIHLSRLGHRVLAGAMLDWLVAFPSGAVRPGPTG